MDRAEFDIEAFWKGDQSVYLDLVARYKDMVFTTCYGFVRNREEADDLTQETFIKLYESRQKFKGDSKVSTWIYRLAVNASLEFLRHHRRQKRSAFRRAISLSDIQVEIARSDVDDIEQKELQAALQAALSRLSEKQRTAFVLSKIKGHSSQEVADIMELTISSVDSLLFRAKQNLKKILQNYYEQNYKQ